MKKTGRKRKSYVTTYDGSTIDGLTRRTDGRWRIIGTDAMFTEHDERKAVARFYELIGERRYEGVSADESRWLSSPAADIVDQNAATAISRGFALVGDAKTAWPRFWQYVADQIRTRPKWVAEQTGIEQLGYLSKLPKPKPLPTFGELEKTWLDHARCSPSQRQKVLRAWHDFIDKAGVRGLDDIQAERSLAYRDDVWKRISHRRDGTSGPISPKQQIHFFSSIKTLLRFNMKRGIAADAINRALANMQCLEASDVANDSDPKPIEADDFKAMLKIANGDDSALLLLMLNGAFYMKEVLALEWSDIDFKKGVIITRRKKRGQCIRVCFLWSETIEALSLMERKGDRLFYNYAGTPLTVSGGQLRFTKLAVAAKVKATASQLRDGAYSAAVDAKVSFDLCRLLAGHSCGIADKYVKRQPSMVAPACEAVRVAYMV